MSEVTFTTTDRGFKHLTPVPGCYGGSVKILESSSAEHPRVWIGITEADDLNASTLAILEHHYQGDVRGYVEEERTFTDDDTV